MARKNLAFFVAIFWSDFQSKFLAFFLAFFRLGAALPVGLAATFLRARSGLTSRVPCLQEIPASPSRRAVRRVETTRKQTPARLRKKKKA